MVDTLKTYQTQQSSIVELLGKLEKFILGGQEFGLSLAPDIKKKLHNAIHNVQGEKLKIALVGGFSEGKTSIAAAWLGRIDASSMKISASESSNEVKIYDIDDNCVLIDTPGLYGYAEQDNADSGEKEKYKDITKKYVSEAHIILYVMNAKNPIKESHRDDLYWLFRELNLLPRTVFVLGRFDEVADVEDESDYQYNLKIKKQNVKDRLHDFLKLSDNEQSSLNIVGISANPFDEGVDYWLENKDEFKKLSHIETLQTATTEIVKANGGYESVVEDARKSIFSDIILKEIPVIENEMKIIARECNKISDLYISQERELDLLKQKISNIKVNLTSSFNSLFADVISMAQGTSLETIGDFLVREIGEEGCIISTNIQNNFERETNQLTTALNTQAIRFEAEIDNIDTALATVTKQGINHLVKNVKMNNTTILAARDGLVAGGKMIGADFALKFKPWGAVKLANKLNSAFAVAGLAMEAWDSWQQAKKQEEFLKARKSLVGKLQEQQKEILNLINANDFISKTFPVYDELMQKVSDLKTIRISEDLKQEKFIKWKKESEVLEGEFKEIC